MYGWSSRSVDGANAGFVTCFAPPIAAAVAILFEGKVLLGVSNLKS
jgi:hypothetical protein